MSSPYHAVLVTALTIILTILKGAGATTINFDPDRVTVNIEDIIIQPDAIEPCQFKAEIVNLSGVGLTEIPSRPFVKSQYIKTLILEGNNITRIPRNGFQETPYLECLNLARNMIAKRWLLKFGHDRIKTLILDHQLAFELDDMSDDNLALDLSEARFPNVETLSLNHIYQDQFPIFRESFPKLINLYWKENALSSMWWNISHVFGPRLKRMHLEGNKITTVYLNDLGNMEALYLDENPLESIRFDTRGSNLKTLSLVNCFDQIEPQIKVHSLITLDLSRNNIEEIPIDMLIEMPLLENLSLSRNRLSAFPYLRLQHLRRLSLSYNFITEIRRPITSSSLKMLSLRGNRITFIDKTAFSMLSVLEVLDLSENDLQTLPADWCESLVMLRFLNLKSNFFKSTMDMMVFALKNLRELHIKDNVIRNMNTNDLQYFPQECVVYV